MVRFSIKKGLRFHKDGHNWTIIRRLMDGSLRLETDEGELLVATEAEILAGCSNGTWRVDLSGQDEVPSLENIVPRDLDSFSVAAQAGASRRQYYLNKLTINGRFTSTPDKLKQEIHKIASERGDNIPPSPVSVYRWYRRYAANGNIVELVDRHEEKGRRQGWSSEVLYVVEEVINTIYLNPQKHPARAVFEEIQRRLLSLQKINPDKSDQLHIPSRSAIYRHVKKLQQYTIDAARLGKPVADRKFRGVFGQQKAERILERWEIDHTPLDLIVYDEESLMPHGRPWLTIAIDKHSRMIVGLYLGFGNPSAYSVLQCLRQAILPKEELLSHYEDITLPWPARGIPEVLVCDNGMEEHSSSLIRACQELNIQIQYCPAKLPEYKGAVERFFRTISQDLVHRLPGTTFSNIWKRGDYPSEQLACIGFRTLNGLLYKWIVEIYHQQVHRGIGMPPAVKWEKGERERIIEYPAHPEQLRIITGHTAERTLFHYGLEINGLKYNSPELQALRRRYGKNLKLLLKSYEDDISYIHVFDPHDKVYIRVPVIDQEYTQGLTLDQHELIRLKLREEARDYMDWNLVLHKKQELQALIDAAVVHKKMGVRKKAAKLRHINTAYPSGIAPGQPPTPEPKVPSITLAGTHALPEFEVSEHVLYEQPDALVLAQRKEH